MEKVYNAYLSEKINNSFGGYAIYLRKSRADAETEARGEGETLARHKNRQNIQRDSKWRND